MASLSNNDQVNLNHRHELENQHRHQEDRILKKNLLVPDIIALTEDNDAKPPTCAPVSDENSSVDYSLGHTPTESEGDFVSGNGDDGPSNSPSPASNIPSPSQPSPPNTSRGGYQAEPKRK